MSAVFRSAQATEPPDDEVARLRVPPHSVEAEQSVLGGLLIDNMAWDRAGDQVSESDFYRYEHREIFTAIAQLINASKPADVITVFEHLQNSGKAEACGGLKYLNDLAQSVPSAANLRRYAEIVRERAILRKLISASDEIATNAFNPQGRQVSQILDEAEGKIFKIGEEGSRNKQGFISIDKLTVQLIDRVTELHENGAEDVTGVRTGFYDMDRMTAGLQPGDLIVLAARPSMGKTAFALNIAEHVAVQEGLPVVVFSMEMGASQLALRMVGSLGPLQSEALTGTLTITLKPGGAGKAGGAGTRIVMEYVVGGYMRYKVDEIAPAVDNVMSGQLAALTVALGVTEAAEPDAAPDGASVEAKPVRPKPKPKP